MATRGTRGWNFFATRLNGDGTETPVADSLPISDPVVPDPLSRMDGLQGTIKPEHKRLKGEDGDPIFLPYKTAIYSELNGRVRSGSMLLNMSAEDSVLSLDTVDFAGHLKDQPFEHNFKGIHEDSFNIVRMLWRTRQSQERSNLGVIVDDHPSGVYNGTPAVPVKFTTGSGKTVEFEAGPYKLNPWTTKDMAKVIDDLAESTPFDYKMEHVRDKDGRMWHYLRLGHPRIGRRIHKRFVVGENIRIPPKVSWHGDQYADRVVVHGAGEGRDMVMGEAWRPSDRLHRTAVVDAKHLETKAQCDNLAEREVRRRMGEEDITDLVVSDSKAARIGSFGSGDEILVTLREGWANEQSLWFRIKDAPIDVNTNTANLSVIRTDKVAS